MAVSIPSAVTDALASIWTTGKDIATEVVFPTPSPITRGEYWNQLGDKWSDRTQYAPYEYGWESGIQDSALKRKLVGDKIIQAGSRAINQPINLLNEYNPLFDIPNIPIKDTGDTQVMSDLGIQGDEELYDTMIHLAGGSNPVTSGLMDLYEKVAENPDPWETLKDTINTGVAQDYLRSGVTMKEMLADPRTVHSKRSLQVLPIDTSVPLTDEINFSGPVQDAARALYDAQQTPVSQALQGVFPQGAPTSLAEEAQPPRSLPIGAPGWQPDIPAQTISPDWNLRDRMSQMYERAFIDPDEYGWARPTIEQRQEAIRGVQDAPEGFWGALQSRIADLIPVAEASISRDVERQQQAPAPISREQEIENMMIEDRAAQLKFHPSSPLYEAPFEEGTGPEEVSEERVKVIKKKPKEKRTSVEEQVVVASEVKKALDNASKGKKVKNELKAIVELAKVDPTIVKRYTTPGSQALQDITAQVDSFSFMPTIQKKKKQPVVDPWAFEDRRGGRR